MNLVILDKEFKKLQQVEEYEYHKFEPKAKEMKAPRHIYYDDLRNDFIEELNTYGFSPYIQKSYDDQKRDKQIMRYKSKQFGNGLYNFIKKSNVGEKKKVVNKLDEIYEGNEEKMNFLQKAFDKLEKNRQNKTVNSFIVEDEKKGLQPQEPENKNGEEDGQEDENEQTEDPVGKLIEKVSEEEDNIMEVNMNAITKNLSRSKSALNVKSHSKNHLAPKIFNNKWNPMMSFSLFNVIEPFKNNIEDFYKAKNQIQTKNKEKNRPQVLYIEKDITKLFQMQMKRESMDDEFRRRKKPYIRGANWFSPLVKREGVILGINTIKQIMEYKANKDTDLIESVKNKIMLDEMNKVERERGKKSVIKNNQKGSCLSLKSNMSEATMRNNMGKKQSKSISKLSLKKPVTVQGFTKIRPSQASDLKNQIKEGLVSTPEMNKKKVSLIQTVPSLKVDNTKKSFCLFSCGSTSTLIDNSEKVRVESSNAHARGKSKTSLVSCKVAGDKKTTSGSGSMSMTRNFSWKDTKFSINGSSAYISPTKIRGNQGSTSNETNTNANANPEVNAFSDETQVRINSISLKIPVEFPLLQ